MQYHKPGDNWSPGTRRVMTQVFKPLVARDARRVNDFPLFLFFHLFHCRLDTVNGSVDVYFKHTVEIVRCQFG